MPRIKKPTETTEQNSDQSGETQVTPEIVKAKICAEELNSPHWIELRREKGLFVEARLHDDKFSIAFGAKSVEAIIRENGMIPAIAENRQIIINFSPHNGEIISLEECPKESVENEEESNQVY